MALTAMDFCRAHPLGDVAPPNVMGFPRSFGGSDGTAYITGTTTSTNLPTTAGAFDEVGRVGGFSDPGDGFVARLSADGSSLVWGTYISGRGLDRLYGIALDDAGNVYVVGDTDSTDDPGTGGIDESYPLVGAAQATFGGVSDYVISKLDPTGSSLIYSTYLGGDDADRSDTELDKPSVALDSHGRAVVSVVSQSTDFHTVAGCNLSSPGPYVVRVAADGASFEACVGVGGDQFVFLRDLVVDTQDRAVVIGYTADPNVVTTAGTFSPTTIGGEEIIIVRTNASGTAIDAGTYFGGTGDDFGNGLAIGPDGNLYLAGRSDSADYPITIGGAPSGDAVVTKLDDTLLNVSYSRTVGYSEALAIAVDALGRASVVGTDGFDAGFTLVAADGGFEHDTFWGGSLFDTANAVALDASGHAYVTGETRSTGFPGDTVLNPTPSQASRSGSIDAWLVKHLRDDPVPPPSLVPALTGGAAILVVGMLLLGLRLTRRR